MPSYFGPVTARFDRPAETPLVEVDAVESVAGFPISPDTLSHLVRFKGVRADLRGRVEVESLRTYLASLSDRELAELQWQELSAILQDPDTPPEEYLAAFDAAKTLDIITRRARA